MLKRRQVKKVTKGQILLIFNYSMNESNQVFSHQQRVVIALTREFRHVCVITNEQPNNDFVHPSNLTIHNVKWVPKQRLRNLVKLIYSVLRVELRFRPTTVFYHMTETQAASLGPFYKLLCKYQVLWYAHASRPIRLRIAALFMNETLASTKGSSPLTETTLIGQAIDVGAFAFNELEILSDKLRIVHIGRLDPSKRISELITWFLKYRNELNLSDLTIFGRPTFGHANYLEKIETVFQKEIEEGLINLPGKASHAEIPGLLMDYDVFLHFFKGSLDKSVLESTACGVITISTNLEFREQFGTWRDRAEGFDKINSLPINDETFLVSEFNAIRRLEISDLRLELDRRRRVVIDNHSYGTWIEQLTKILKQGKA